LVRNAGDDPRGDGKLHGAEAQRLTRRLLGDAVDLEQDAARLHARRPELHRTLALAHADFGRLLGNRQVGEDTDPDAALALHLAGDRAAGRLDLPRGDALGLLRLEAELAEGQVDTALGDAVDATLVGLPELGAFRLQHSSLPS